MRKIFALFLGALALFPVTGLALSYQACYACSLGCPETTSSLQYGNLLCSCPTGTIVMDSGGICVSSQYSGSAFCWDSDNGCGGLYTLYTDVNCGCDYPYYA